MDWQPILNSVWNWADDNWPELVGAAVLALLTYSWGKWRQRRRWVKRQFTDRINVSLNVIHQVGRGKIGLKIRTVFERGMDDVFLSHEAIDMVAKAAAKTSYDAPVLKFPSADDGWFVLNEVLNEIVELFAVGTVAVDATGGAIAVTGYDLCLTCERISAHDAAKLKLKPEDIFKAEKVRAMLVRHDCWDMIETVPTKAVTFERPHHRNRWDTLRRLAKIRREDASSFMYLELPIPMPAQQTSFPFSDDVEAISPVGVGQ